MTERRRIPRLPIVPIQRAMLSDLRSWSLLAAAGICGSRAIVYALSNEPLPYGLRNVADLLPAWVYSIIWAGTCCILTVAALWQQPVRSWHAFAVGMPILWGCFYAAGAVLQPDGQFVNAFGNAWLWWFIGARIGLSLLIPPRMVPLTVTGRRP